MMNNIILIIYLISVSFTLTHLYHMYSLIREVGNFWKLLKILVTCWKCISFWITLIVLQDINIACVVFTITYWLDLNFNKGIEL